MLPARQSDAEGEFVKSLRALTAAFVIVSGAGVVAAPPAIASQTQTQAERLQRYGDVINRLVAEMVACSPESWANGRLSIQFDGARLTYQLRNPGHPERAELSPELIALIDELAVRMIRDGSVWSEARIDFTRSGDRVSFDAAFDYVDS